MYLTSWVPLLKIQHKDFGKQFLWTMCTSGCRVRYSYYIFLLSFVNNMVNPGILAKIMGSLSRSCMILVFFPRSLQYLGKASNGLAMDLGKGTMASNTWWWVCNEMMLIIILAIYGNKLMIDWIIHDLGYGQVGTIILHGPKHDQTGINLTFLAARVDPLTSILAVLARSCQILSTSWERWIPWQGSY